MPEEPIAEDSSLDQPVAAEAPTPSPAPPAGRQPKVSKRTLLIGLAVLILLALLLGSIPLLVKKEVKQTTKPTVTINTQTLDNGTLNKLSAQTGPTGAVKQQLTITPDTLFKGNISAQGSAQIDKDLNVGGNLNVHGTSTLQGAVGVNGSLAVRGSLSVGGTLTAPALNVGSLGVTTVTTSGNVSFGGHLVPTGSQPSAKTSVAASGGSVTISGNDTAGTVTINIGNGTLVAGEMAIITFAHAFTTTPKVQLTPINAGSAAINYYASRSATFFTVDTATMPTAGASYVFDYLVTQ